MKKRVLVMGFVGALVLALTTGCSTTQKTPGIGLTSAVAQNVVRIACVKALRDADFSSLEGQPVYLKLTGFADESNRGILEHLFTAEAEKCGARIVSEDKAKLELEVATMSAGNDAGRSSIPIISHSERVEGLVDVQIAVRKCEDRSVLYTQSLHGEAKYQQNTVIGFQGTGHYYVKIAKNKFERVENPATYR